MFRLLTETTCSFRCFSFSPGYLDPALLFSFSTFLQMHSMQRRQQQKLKSDAILTNLEPLLLVIRKELGLDWCFYKEFLDCVRTATLKGEDTSIWVYHIEPLVQEPTLQFAHHGFLKWRGRKKVVRGSDNFLSLSCGRAQYIPSQ
jgi:hypothetical protein